LLLEFHRRNDFVKTKASPFVDAETLTQPIVRLFSCIFSFQPKTGSQVTCARVMKRRRRNNQIETGFLYHHRN